MTRLLGIPGSLRSGSFNAALVRAAAELAPEGVEVEVGSIAGFPVYDGDLERREGEPEASLRLKERIVAADGLLIATPEYSTGIPGAAKNAFDWLARPPDDVPRVFGGLPVGLIGATPGRGGTRFSQMAWLQVLRYLGTRPWFGASLYLAGARDAFDEELRLADEKLRELVGRYVAGFAAFCAAHPRG